MADAPLAFLPDLFELHVEELGFLWQQRRAALHDPERTLKSLIDLDRRLDAHLDGVLAIGAEMPPRLRPTLENPDAAPPALFASSVSLLRARDAEGARTLLARCASAEGDALTAVADALAWTAPPRLLEHLLPLTTDGPPARRLALASVFAMRGATIPDAHALESLATHDDATVRRAAWRLLAHRGTAVAESLLTRALADDEPSVRAAAVDAALWLQHPTLLDHARARLSRATPADLPLLGALAMLGGTDDHARLTHLVGDAALGPGRLELARRVGTPDMVERCIALMAPELPEVAVAAGLAFWRITGESVAGPTRVTLGAPPADAFEAAFADEAVLPDSAEAQQRWARIRRPLTPQDRLMHGVALDAAVTAEQFARFDVLARREWYQRQRWLGGGAVSPLALEAFPQR